MIEKRTFKYTPIIEFALILIIAAVTYLPALSQASVYRDDWYYIMDRVIGGPGTFQQMFSIDRPARGPLFETYFQLFGTDPLPYHLSSFAWRALAGLAAWWLFRLLWPRQRQAAFLMAVLFTLYPGYLRWMEGFEDQPRILSVFLQVLSIALTIKALKTTRKIPRIAAWAASILTGWAYIAFLDFAIGMEAFRLLCVFVLIGSQPPARSFLQKSLASLRAWAPAAIIPAGFLFWRLFIFHNLRPATDINLQLSYLLKSPLSTGAEWLVRLFQSAANVILLAWAAPRLDSLLGMELRPVVYGLLVAGVAALVMLFAYLMLEKIEKSNPAQPAPDDRGWQAQAVRIGLIGVVVGLLPVILANRYVTFTNYSHYSLPVSLASAFVVVGLVFSTNSRILRVGSMLVLVALAVLTQYAAASQVLYEEKVIANFWQQVAWRAPGIKAGTSLVINYPGIAFNEDVDAAAGPANFLYFPGQTNQIPAVYPLVALPQMEYTTLDVINGGSKTYGYRTHTGEINYDNILVISQPTEGSCVHVINPQWPRYTDREADQILLLGAYSKIGNVTTSGTPPQPDPAIFGPEPAHNWCYYYQKAELALQQGDWEQIVKLGSEVDRQDLHPADRVEWVPFLQAYAYTGNEELFTTVTADIVKFQFVRTQACDALLQMQTTSPFTPQIQARVDAKLCRGRTSTN